MILAVMALAVAAARGESSATSAVSAKSAVAAAMGPKEPEVRLRILKPDGTALGHEKVFVCNNKGAEYEARPTDAQGWVGVEPQGNFGLWQVAVWAPGAGYVVSEPFEVKKAEATPAQTLRLKAGGTLTGRVVDKETGVPAAKIQVTFYLQGDDPLVAEYQGAHLFPAVKTETGADGVWTVSGLRPGAGWSVEPSLEPGGAFLGGDGIEDIALAEGQTVKCKDIQLERGADLRGVVLASDSKTPVAGAWVLVEINSITVSTDANGAFLLRGFAAGEIALMISASGYVSQKLTVEIPADKKVAQQRIVLSRNGGTICGTVVDEGGRPVTGELVVVMETQGYEQYFGRAWLAVTAETWSSYKEGGALRFVPEQRTDAAGRFEFKLLAGGEHVVIAVDQFLPQQASGAITVEEGKAAPAVKLTMSRKPAGFLAGRLLKPDGSPLVAAEIPLVLAFRNGQDWSSSGLTVRTDREGRFYFGLQQSGTMKITLAVPGFRLAEFEMEVFLEKAAERDVTLVAEKADAEITGKILRPDGTPAPGVLVTPFVAEQWPGFSPVYGSKTYYLDHQQAVETGSDGTFHLGGLRPGVYGLIAQTTRMPFGFGNGGPLRPELAGCCSATVAENVKVAESGRASVAEARLIKGAKITVTITDATSGRPLANARLTVQPVELKEPFRWRMVNNASTNAQGHAQLDSLLPGKYSVFITAPNHKPLRLVNKDALLLESGQEVEIKVPLQAAPGAEPEKATA